MHLILILEIQHGDFLELLEADLVTPSLFTRQKMAQGSFFSLLSLLFFLCSYFLFNLCNYTKLDYDMRS